MTEDQVARVIEELVLRPRELGLTTEAEDGMSPPKIVASALTYFRNLSGRMNAPEYSFPEGFTNGLAETLLWFSGKELTTDPKTL